MDGAIFAATANERPQATQVELILCWLVSQHVFTRPAPNQIVSSVSHLT